MIKVITAVASRLQRESFFILLSAVMLASLAYFDHMVFTTAALILFASKIYLDMSEAIVLQVQQVRN